MTDELNKNMGFAYMNTYFGYFQKIWFGVLFVYVKSRYNVEREQSGKKGEKKWAKITELVVIYETVTHSGAVIKYKKKKMCKFFIRP